MKTLLNLKYVDLLIQALALFIPLILCFTYGKLYMAYFTVGGAQLLSCLANLGLPSRLSSDQRKYYEWTMTILILVFLIAALFLLPVILYLAAGLLFVSPFWAVWYALICYEEMCTVQRYTNRKKYVLTN
jgi:hypothetical protein